MAIEELMKQRKSGRSTCAATPLGHCLIVCSSPVAALLAGKGSLISIDATAVAAWQEGNPSTAVSSLCSSLTHSMGLASALGFRHGFQLLYSRSKSHLRRCAFPMDVSQHPLAAHARDVWWSCVCRRLYARYELRHQLVWISGEEGLGCSFSRQPCEVLPETSWIIVIFYRLRPRAVWKPYFLL